MKQKLNNLSITQKVVLVILASILFLASTLYLVASNIHPQSYLNIENESLLKDLNRADDAIKNLFPQLAVKLQDWASWDDTYQYVTDLNQEYYDSNLGSYNLANLKINSMIFADPEGNIVFIRVIDSLTDEEVDHAEIKKYFEKHRELITHPDTNSSIAGILSLSEGPFLFTSLPILTSAGEGPIHGSLTFGTYIDEELIAEIGALTHLTLEAFPYGRPDTPDDVIDAEMSLTAENNQFIIPLSETSIAAYRVLDDYYGRPLITLKVEESRDVYLQGKSTFSFYMVATSVSLILFGLTLIVLLEFFVVSRFTRLEKKVKLIGEKNDLSMRIKEGAKDEIGQLASSINVMLEQIENAEKAEDESNEKVRAISEILKKRLEETEKINKMMINRELKMMELKKELAKYKGDTGVE
jgi:sensor domain CHASE-containing protein